MNAEKRPTTASKDARPPLTQRLEGPGIADRYGATRDLVRKLILGCRRNVNLPETPMSGHAESRKGFPEMWHRCYDAIHPHGTLGYRPLAITPVPSAWIRWAAMFR